MTGWLCPYQRLSADDAGKERTGGHPASKRLFSVRGNDRDFALGWGYLLISDETPKLRALEILNQSQADVLITDLVSARELQEKGLSIPILDAGGDFPAVQEAKETRKEASMEDLAYVVYTSGSTGKPKEWRLHRKAL